MKNCKVHKFNSVINNPDLEKYNSLKLYKISGTTNIVVVNVGTGNAKIYSDGNLTFGGYPVQNGYSYTGSGSLNTDGTYIEVIGKYDIIRISSEAYYFMAEDFVKNYSGEITIAAYNPDLIKGDIDKLKFDIIHLSQGIPIGTTTKDISAVVKYTIESDVTLIISTDNTIEGNVGEAINATEGGNEYIKNIYNYSYNSKLELNLDDLSECTNFIRILWNGTSVYGNLSALSRCTNIEAISFRNINFDEDVSVLLDELSITKKSGSINLYLGIGNTLNGAAWNTLPENQNHGVIIDFNSSGWSVRQNP